MGNLWFRLPEMPVRDMPIFEDASSDGQRMLLKIPIENRSAVDFHVILNWASLVRKNQYALFTAETQRAQTFSKNNELILRYTKTTE